MLLTDTATLLSWQSEESALTGRLPVKNAWGRVLKQIGREHEGGWPPPTFEAGSGSQYSRIFRSQPDLVSHNDYTYFIVAEQHSRALNKLWLATIPIFDGSLTDDVARSSI